jgi:hypothetical protein
MREGAVDLGRENKQSVVMRLRFKPFAELRDGIAIALCT